MDKNVSIDQAKKEKLFYVVATVVICQKDKKALILKRSQREIAHPGMWGVVGGKLEWDIFSRQPDLMNGNVPNWYRTVEELLAREAKEEAGIEIKTDTLKYIGNLAFVRPDQVPVFCVKFAVQSKTTQVIIDQRDFDDFAWVDLNEIKKYSCIEGIDREVARALSIFSNDK